MNGTKELTLLEKGEAEALQRQAVAQTAGLVTMIERMASDPAVDVDKFERFLAMHERLKAQDAKAQYFAAFAQLQGDIPQIKETGKVSAGQAGVRMYATNEDIQRVVRPILQRHGFSLTFRTEFPAGAVKIVGILSHKAGHSEQTEFVSAVDAGAGRNAIQSIGSTISYGIRYTTRALLNITSGEASDDDGEGATTGKPTAKPEPRGFSDWWTDLQLTAEQGSAALKEAWEASPKDLRKYLTDTNTRGWEQLKRKAAGVK